VNRPAGASRHPIVALQAHRTPSPDSDLDRHSIS
jgi:hypothetical protein